VQRPLAGSKGKASVATLERVVGAVDVQAGQREMVVWVNGQTYTIDVAEAAGGAFTGLVVKRGSAPGGARWGPPGPVAGVLLRPSGPAMLPPMISGIEVSEIVRSSQANSSSNSSIKKYSESPGDCR